MNQDYQDFRNIQTELRKRGTIRWSELSPSGIRAARTLVQLKEARIVNFAGEKRLQYRKVKLVKLLGDLFQGFLQKIR